MKTINVFVDGVEGVYHTYKARREPETSRLLNIKGTRHEILAIITKNNGTINVYIASKNGARRKGQANY